MINQITFGFTIYNDMKMKIVLFVSFCFLMVSCAKKTDVEELPQIVEVEFEQISLPEDIFGFDYM